MPVFIIYQPCPVLLVFYVYIECVFFRFTDLVDVIQAVSSHPDPQVASHITVGAVTVCVDPQNSYMCDNYTLPKLLDQCAQGWVNNIVMTGTTASQVHLM